MYVVFDESSLSTVKQNPAVIEHIEQKCERQPSVSTTTTEETSNDNLATSR